jgi:hypothetical protein
MGKHSWLAGTSTLPYLHCPYFDSSLPSRDCSKPSKGQTLSMTAQPAQADRSTLYQVSPQEMQAVVAAYKDTADPKKVWGTGLHIAGEKYVTLKADDRSLYGKKVSNKLPSTRLTPPRLKELYRGATS